jgi:hypothetical protein
VSVRKLRSLREAEDAAWRDPKDPRFWETVAALWRFSRRFAPGSFPPGVHKSRSLKEQNAREAEWARASSPEGP